MTNDPESLGKNVAQVSADELHPGKHALGFTVANQLIAQCASNGQDV